MRVPHTRRQASARCRWSRGRSDGAGWRQRFLLELPALALRVLAPARFVERFEALVPRLHACLGCAARIEHIGAWNWEQRVDETLHRLDLDGSGRSEIASAVGQFLAQAAH